MTKNQQLGLAANYVEADGVPVVFGEVSKAFQLAWPLTVFNVAGYAIVVITVMFVGRNGGELELSVAIVTFNFGFIGGALGTTTSYTFLLIILALYTWGSGKYGKTWDGFTWEAFDYVGDYMKLALPSTCMMCFEFWTVELLVLTAGLLPKPELQVSILIICLYTTNVAYNVPIGLSAAVRTRVSNELGAFRPAAAKLAGKVILGISICCAICIASSMLITRHVLGKAYSRTEEVVVSVASLMPLVALSSIFDGIQGVLSGIARGCGRQDIGAIINLTVFYIVGLPSGLLLDFMQQMNVKGLWIGYLVGQFLQTLLLVLLVATTNWNKMAEAALRRVHAAPLLPTSDMNER